jgi:GT2 family glycosyltransferase
VEVAVDDAPAVAISYGLVRSDVASRYGIAAERSGFIGLVPVARHEDRRTLRLACHVVLEGGHRVRWHQRTVRLYDAGLAARLDRLAGAIREALQVSARERRLPPAIGNWPATLWRHWRGDHVATPVRVAQPTPFDRARFEESFRRARAADDDRAITAQRDSLDEGPVITVPSDSNTLARLCDDGGRWLPPGDSEFVVLLDPTTVPTRDGLARVRQAIVESAADWVYSDDCRRDAAGAEYDPYLKGTFSREQALFDDYATRLAIGRRSAIARAGGLDASFGEAAIHDLVLRLASSGARFHHLAHVCAYRAHEARAVRSAQHLRAAEHALNGEQLRGISVGLCRAPWLGAEHPRVVWPDAMLDAQPVTIVIPTRDQVALLQRCIDSLRRTVHPRRTRLLIVDDRSRQRATRDYLEALARTSEFACVVTRLSHRDGQFNYARLMNHAARLVETPLMLHLNNDIEAIAPGWLDQMCGWMSQPGVGIVGAKLLYRDGSIQHAGVAVSSSHGVPTHIFRRLVAGEEGYQQLAHRLRNVSAVTGACLLTRTALYRELEGFDADHLPVQFNDVDFCLRAAARGCRVVYEPAAVLYHEESASRGGAFDYRENAYFLATYPEYREPFVSPQIAPDSWFGSTPLVASPNRLA